MTEEIEQLKEQARKAVAKYMYSEGCSCCRDIDEHESAALEIAKVLDMDLYSDQSGIDYRKYLTTEG